MFRQWRQLKEIVSIKQKINSTIIWLKHVLIKKEKHDWQG